MADGQLIIRARTDAAALTFYAPTLDAAVEFSAWLTDQGYEVEMFEGSPAAYPRTPEEERAADALTEMYARSLPR